jgi:plastocyanin
VAALALCASPARGYEEAPVPDGGILAGTLRFAGTPPALPPLPVNKNRDLCGPAVPAEALVVGPGGGVQGGVVLVDGIGRGRKAAGEAVLDNARCRFVPHVLALMAGSRVRVRNGDPILHNTHGLQEGRTVFNLALPMQGQSVDVSRRLTRPGVVRVLCDAHPHMAAWIVVHDSPYLAVTDAAGAYRIEGIPPGNYAVRLWHEGYREVGRDKDGRPLYEEPQVLRQDVTIRPGATTRLDVELR